MEFAKATRQAGRLRVGLLGPSGSGKTYSALRLAKGLGGKCAMIDTESHRSAFYADEFAFDVLNLEPAFSPERYIEAIEAAEQAGYDVVIIDSASHEWNGRGGILDSKSHMSGSNDWAKWAKLTPRHDQFIDKLVRADCHLIVTIRGKDVWVLEDEAGKQKPKKVGMGGQQRDGMEYEFTVSFLLDQESHVATVTKDNTHLFEHRYELLTEVDGESLLAWAQTGERPKQEAPKAAKKKAPPAPEQTESTDKASYYAAVDALAEMLDEPVIDSAHTYIKEHEDTKDLDRMLDRLNELINEKKAAEEPERTIDTESGEITEPKEDKKDAEELF